MGWLGIVKCNLCPQEFILYIQLVVQVSFREVTKELSSKTSSNLRAFFFNDCFVESEGFEQELHARPCECISDGCSLNSRNFQQ